MGYCETERQDLKDYRGGYIRRNAYCSKSKITKSSATKQICKIKKSIR